MQKLFPTPFRTRTQKFYVLVIKYTTLRKVYIDQSHCTCKSQSTRTMWPCRTTVKRKRSSSPVYVRRLWTPPDFFQGRQEYSRRSKISFQESKYKVFKNSDFLKILEDKWSICLHPATQLWRQRACTAGNKTLYNDETTIMDTFEFKFHWHSHPGFSHEVHSVRSPVEICSSDFLIFSKFSMKTYRHYVKECKTPPHFSSLFINSLIIMAANEVSKLKLSQEIHCLSSIRNYNKDNYIVIKRRY